MSLVYVPTCAFLLVIFDDEIFKNDVLIEELANDIALAEEVLLEKAKNNSEDLDNAFE